MTTTFGASAIVVNKVLLQAVIGKLEKDIAMVRDVVSTANAGEVPAGSKALTAYARSLEDALSMLDSLTGLLAKDASSHNRAISRFVAQDR